MAQLKTPMDTHSNFSLKIKTLQELLRILQSKPSYVEKVQALDELPIVQSYLKEFGFIQNFLEKLAPEPAYALKSIIAIGQAPIVFNLREMTESESSAKIVALLEQLLEIEFFYSYLGGIIGYYCIIIDLLDQHLSHSPSQFDSATYLQPLGIHIDGNNPKTSQAVRWGIEHLEDIGALFPLGGSGDRLDLRHSETKEALPAALLPFLGRSLLDGLIRDLQAWEFLAFKLLGKRLHIPVAVMTSVEKNNHLHILSVCKQNRWYGRGSSNFHFFIQPLAPVITENGDWSLSSPLTLNLKPSGHGVLWKLAEEAGVFNWFESRGKPKCLVRQINNPLAATDKGILALIGIGCEKKKNFGFLSCDRIVGSEEGTNVLIERKSGNRFEYCLTNIEYTEFKLRGLQEAPREAGSAFSLFPANTNILFGDFKAIRNALKKLPIPGQLINLKSKVPYLDPQGNLHDVLGGRLESTMQNIADAITDSFEEKLQAEEIEEKLSSFIVYQARSKTISTTKKTYKKDFSPLGTPEQAYFDLLSNNYLLLKTCGFALPPWVQLEECLCQPPPVLFLFHPALGPLYSVVAQKIRGGEFFTDSELQLEITEVDIENLALQGSLLIQSDTPLGGLDENELLAYEHSPKCTLKNVSIKNEGIDREKSSCFWKNDLMRRETCTITLHEGAEFYAEGVCLEGNLSFEVPSFTKLTLSTGGDGSLIQKNEPLEAPSWEWHYHFDLENNVRLKKARFC